MIDERYFTVVLSCSFGDMMLKFQDVVANDSVRAVNKCKAQMAIQNHWFLEEVYEQSEKAWSQ